MTELEKYIQTYFGVATDDLEKISPFFKSRILRKGDFFLRAGRPSDKLGFVQSGIVREFTSVGDQEITKWISTKGYFAVDLTSFSFGTPARFTIQALTDCELHVMDLSDYRQLGRVVPRWADLEKAFIVKCFGALEDRVVQHLSLSAEERYEQLFQFNKELFNSVPLQYLASMLGMTPETFSRIRKKASDKNS